MPTPDLYPIPFPTLVDRLDREIRRGDAIYTLRPRDWWTPVPGRDPGLRHFGRQLATPAGPASGPHTQLAQNLAMGWLCGGRFFELKTVQINDQLEIPRPCIFVPHVGYNVEWSQELRINQSAREYVKGWMLVHFLASELGPGLWRGVDAAFDLSLGYDLAGIQSAPMRAYVESLRDASALLEELRAELPPALSRWRDVPVPAEVCDAVTLSTFHGCPADEIEAIASFTLDLGLHTVVKLNPTLLGYDRVRAILDGLGYTDPLIQIQRAAFDKDLQWDQLLAMIPRLRARAAANGLGFGVKLTNTLVCHSPEPPFSVSEMYLSGPPLHVLAMQLGARIREVFPDLAMTFSAGIDARNFAQTVACGLGPVTSCSDLLKGGGYTRMTRYVRALEERLGAAGASCLDELAPGTAQSLPRRAASLLQDMSYHRVQNAIPPKKVGTQLDLLDCLTCDKCIPVCPNGANFALSMPTGTHQPGRLVWKDAEFALEPGLELRVEKRHQIGNFADACNLCGQCDPWCPEDGGPYLVKPNLFGSEESFDAHPERDGFLLSADRRVLRWRRGDAHYLYTRQADGLFCLQTTEGAVLLDGDRPVSTEGVGALDLRVAVTLRLFLDAFSDPEAALWLPPVPPPPQAPLP